MRHHPRVPSPTPFRFQAELSAILLVLLTSFMLSGCITNIGDVTSSSPSTLPATLPVMIIEQPLAQPADPCEDRFVAHELDHLTRPQSTPIRMFESNGAGLAVNDLDNDGDLDLVFANLKGPASLLWNEGSLEFRRQPIEIVQRSRAVNAVDVDGDGQVDLVFTNGTGAPIRLRNVGGGDFEMEPLPGVLAPAYAINWSDWDADGDLDFAVASYDAGLMQERGDAFLFSDGGGVVAYEKQDGRYVGQRLSDEAQGLALALLDLDGDDLPDLVVGNDFDLPDQIWSRQANGDWHTITPFSEITHSTMSFDRADVDNDGRWELFATDMKPYSDDPETMAAWAPLIEEMMMHEDEVDTGADSGTENDGHADDPQVMENVLHQRDAAALYPTAYHNEARQSGIDATGWSWSSKFGDLDQDGHVDLYVVNGMIAEELFGHLPGGELVEENQALRNDGTGQFEPAPKWGLGSESSGRGMSMADLDLDGDLDIVVNNLNAPAQLFENRLCGGDSLQVDLRWPDSANPLAIGAEVTLHTSAGHTMHRDVRAASGYLSGEPSRLHFGFSSDVEPLRLDIRWPDGQVSALEQLSPSTLITVER